MRLRSLKRLVVLSAVAVVAGVPAATATATPAYAVSAAEIANGCDPVDPAACLLPFPSDYYTVADSATDTGIRVNFVRDGMPANIFGTHINPWEWNRNDGFSPGRCCSPGYPGSTSRPPAPRR